MRDHIRTGIGAVQLVQDPLVALAVGGIGNGLIVVPVGCGGDADGDDGGLPDTDRSVIFPQNLLLNNGGVVVLGVVVAAEGEIA